MKANFVEGYDNKENSVLFGRKENIFDRKHFYFEVKCPLKALFSAIHVFNRQTTIHIVTPKTNLYLSCLLFVKMIKLLFFLACHSPKVDDLEMDNV